MITADKVFKGSNEIIKVYQGLQLLWEKQGGPSVEDYIQGGLVFQLDGMDKGNGAWVDRKGQKEFALHNVIVNDNNIEFNGTDSYAEYGTPLGYSSATHTLEIVWESSKVTGVPFFGGPTDAEVCSMQQKSTAIRRLSFGTGMNFIGTQPDELKMISANADNIIYNAGWIGTSAALEVSNSFDQTVASIGRYKQGDYFKGKIYAIRIYDRKLTALEMLQNQLIDIERFGLDSHFETINLTLNSSSGADMTGCKFMLDRQMYEYTGSTMTFKVMGGKAYQLTYDSFLEHQGPSNPDPVVAIAGQVKDITANYIDNGWGDYLVLDTTLDGIDNSIFYNATIQGSREKVDDTTYRYKIKCNDGWRTKSNFSSRYIKKVNQWPSIQPTTIWLGQENYSIITYVAPLITDANVYLLGPTSGVESNLTIVGGKTVSFNGLPDTTKSYQTLNNNIVINSTSNYVNTYFGNTTKNIGFAVGTHKYGRIKIANISGDNKIDKYYFLLTNFLTTDTDIRINPSNNTVSEWKYVEFVDLFKDLGTWKYDLTRLNNWGTGGEENRQSVVNSLITNNIDRTQFENAGNATITLAYKTKALLTEDEIAQITAKGYTLS